MSATLRRVRHADFLEPATLADPYPLLAELRDREAALASERSGSVWLFRYDSVAATLRHPALVVGPVGQNLNRLTATTLAPEEREACRDAMQVRADFLFYLDPPRHTQLRNLVRAWFTPASVRALRPRIGALAVSLVEATRHSGVFDAMEAVANRLPAMVMARLLGLPVGAWPAMPELAASLTATAVRGKLARDANLGARDAIAAFRERLWPQIEARRWRPESDLLTVLTQALDAGVCDERELLALCTSLAIAGYETTRGAIGNALATLLRHPEQLARLRAEPALIDPAIDEVLRLESPVQVTARVAREAVEIEGIAIRAGALIECWLGAANRDPARFPDPDRFDIARAPNRHLGFGLGPHHCLGFALARLETAAVLRAVLREQRPFALAEPLRWRAHGMFRSLETLQISWK